MTVSPAGPTSTRPASFASRVVLSVFFVFFLAMGLIFSWLVLRDAAAGWDTWTWTRTPCEIDTSGVRQQDEHGRSVKGFVPDVTYHYEFGGQSFSSRQLGRKTSSYQDYTKAAKRAANYQPHASASCYVNPKAPSEAVLERSSLLFPLLILFPMVFVLIGGGGIYITWRGGPVSGLAAQPISSRATSRFGPLVGFAFFSIFLLVGIGLFYALFARPLLKILAAKRWVEVPCVVISSEVQSQRGDHGNTYRVNILYAYSFNGREYKANRYDFMGGSSSGYAGKRRIVDAHPPGSKGRCYVNPVDPAEAVLVRSFTPMMWLGLFPLVFVLAGAAGLKKFRRRSAPDVVSGVVGYADVRTSPGVPGYVRSDSAPLVLKPRATPVTKLVATIFIALFWNGIVSVFVVSAFHGARSGSWHWFPLLFTVPFVLVGLGMIVAALYFLLAMFNPRPHITVTPGAVPLGGTMDLEWELKGRVDVLQGFRILLEGREEATYRRGTNTSTDRSVFAELEIADLTLQAAMRTGRGSVVVPVELMHSFSSRNNKIIWAIRVHGDIARWPDVNEEFPVTVLPRSGIQGAGI